MRIFKFAVCATVNLLFLRALNEGLGLVVNHRAQSEDGHEWPEHLCKTKSPTATAAFARYCQARCTLGRTEMHGMPG